VSSQTSPRTRLERLSPLQLQEVAAYRSRWAAIGVETRPADRAAAEAGVRVAYRCAGLSLPRIEWSEGPLEFASVWRNSSRSAIGSSVKREIHDHPLARVVAQAEARVSLGVRHAVINGTRLPAATSLAVNEVVNAAVEEARPRLWARLKEGWRIRRSPRFRDSGWGHPDFAWLAACDYLSSLCGRSEGDALEAILAIAANSGWFVPHEHVCWLGERPQRLKVDDRGRLHSREGPALEYRDGLSIYMWKGVQVPDWMIEQPNLITPSFIDRHPDFLLRRCMIEIMTPAQYVASGGAVPIARDETGILWRKQWWNNDAWAAVEVVNGTAEPDGTYRHYFLQVPPNVRSPREAVAWTYGMTETEYTRLRVRT
jgi:hypothetical protein